MSDPIQLDIPGPNYLVDPPIIDFLAHDPDLHCYVAEFLPEAQVSIEQKESVFVPDASATARRITELLIGLTQIAGLVSSVVKIAHAGGGDFDLYLEDGSSHHLHGSPSPEVSFDVYAVLQVLSQEVQFEFISQRRAQNQRAAK